MKRRLDKRAKELILEAMYEMGEVTTEAVMDLIAPHYMFDPVAARQQELRRKANSLMSQMRDTSGVRDVFNYKDIDGESVYVHVGYTKDPAALSKVEERLLKQFRGIRNSTKKVRRQRKALSQQITLNFEKQEQTK